MTATRPPPDASPASRTLHFLTAWSSKAAASTFAAATCAVVFGSAIASRHPDPILVWFAAVAGALTLVMVFVLQHTQTRQQDALHHKLDEVLHALPDADDRLIKLESASDSEVVEIERRHTALRDDAHES
jgi:low affinity Fe/Cu permease